MVDYLSGDEDSRLIRLREAITTLGKNPTGGTTYGENVALSKIQRAIYDGEGLVKVEGSVHFGDSHKLIDALASDRQKLYNAVVNGNIGLLELLEAAEDVSITPRKKENILYAFIEAVLKVAISGAGVANDIASKFKLNVGDLDGKMLTGLRKFDQERAGLKKEVKKSK